MLLFFFKKNNMYVSSLRKGPCKISLRKKKKNVQLIPWRREYRYSCAGLPIISPALRGRLFRDIRTFERAVEGSSVSPLTNTLGGLSGGGRGGDTSGVCMGYLRTSHAAQCDPYCRQAVSDCSNSSKTQQQSVLNVQWTHLDP